MKCVWCDQQGAHHCTSKPPAIKYWDIKSSAVQPDYTYLNAAALRHCRRMTYLAPKSFHRFTYPKAKLSTDIVFEGVLPISNTITYGQLDTEFRRGYIGSRL